MSDSMQSPFPVPTGVSEEARAFLSQPPNRPAYPALDDVDGWLTLIKEGDAHVEPFLPPTPDTMVEEVLEFGGARSYRHRLAAGTTGGPVYLTLHPGGLIQMGGDICRKLGALSAAWLGIEVWSVDYRMPPIAPFPAGLDDCLAVYRELVTTRDPAKILVGGVSAGGNLAAALMLRVKEEGLPMPAALHLGTPEIDLTESGDSFQTNREVDNTLSSLREVNLLYANGHDLSDPLLSPLFGDVSDFPPTILTTGTRDLFLSNTVRMHRKLLTAGVDAELHVFEAMPHNGFGGISPEDLEMRAQVAQFLHRHLPAAAKVE